MLKQAVPLAFKGLIGSNIIKMVVFFTRSQMPQLNEANIPFEEMIYFKDRKLSGTS
jgi:hypothetical protein